MMDNRRSSKVNTQKSVLALSLFMVATLILGTTAFGATTAWAQDDLIGGPVEKTPTTAPTEEESKPTAPATEAETGAPTIGTQPRTPVQGGAEEAQPETQGGGGGDNLNCADITERNFAIDPANDPNNFDGDNDGIGCETDARGTVAEPEAVAPTTTTAPTGNETTAPAGNETTAPAAGGNETAAEEEPSPEVEAAATAVQGNGGFAIEQFTDLSVFTAECLAQIDAAVGSVVELVLIQNPEVAAAVDTAVEELTPTVEQQLPATVNETVTTEAEKTTEELAATETPATEEEPAATGATMTLPEEVITAVEEVTPKDVVEEIVEDAIIEEIAEDTGISDQVTDVVATEVAEVIAGDATPAEASTEIVEQVQEIANGTEITVEDVQAAVEDPTAITEEVVEDIAPEQVAAPTEEAPAAGGNETAPAVVAPTEEKPATEAPSGEVTPATPEEAQTETVIEEAVVDAAKENIIENAVEVAGPAEVQQDPTTVLAQINQAIAALEEAKSLLG